MSFRRMFIEEEEWLWASGKANIIIKNPSRKTFIVPKHEILGITLEVFREKTKRNIIDPVMPSMIRALIESRIEQFKEIPNND